MVAETSAPVEQSEQAEPVSIMVQMPPILRDAIVEQAKAKEDMPVSRWIREFLAEGLGITLPPPRPRKRYATEEERIAAAKARETRAAVVDAVLARYATEQGLDSAAGIEEFARKLGLLPESE